MDHDHDDITQAYDTFLRQSHVDVIIPRSKDINVDALLKKPVEELQQIPTRSHIFFDETITACIVLKSSTSEDIVGTLLSHLEVVASAHATNAQDASPAASKHEVATKKIAAISHEGISKVSSITYVVWTIVLHVTKLPVKLQRPAVYFTANLVLSKNGAAERTTRTRTRFLPAYQPLPNNVLESLRLGSSQEGLYLSETRITKAAAVSPRLDDTVKSLRGATKRAFPIVPVIIPKLRYTAVGKVVLISLHIEASQMLAGEVNLQDISVTVTGTVVERIPSAEDLSRLQAGDEVALIYKIVRNRSFEKEAVHAVASVDIKASALLEHGTQIDLEVSWQTTIDVSSTSLTKEMTWSDTNEWRASQPVQPPELQVNGSIVFEFSAPKDTSTGSTFGLCVRCINKSDRTRHFTVDVQSHGGHNRPTSMQSLEQQSSRALATTPHLQLGPIKPGDCYEADVKYTALASGVQDLGGIRIFDTDSKRAVNIYDLPDIVAYSDHEILE